ncbi:unnamed protein product [Spirodela intermedia]|uniref:Uncharacterized protein n=1 Tax=Spirodela intermedia TaxID=51605 RepID=A0A7I8LHA4_SPIIN|nr:unnamed protein product [Spirodela intermedia]
MLHCGDATEGKRSFVASGAVKGPGDVGYPMWAMCMQLHLEAHNLGDAIEPETIARKKDRQALSKQWDLLRSTKRSSNLVSKNRRNKSFFLTGLRKQRVEIFMAEDMAKVRGVAEVEDEAMREAQMKIGSLVTNPQ